MRPASRPRVVLWLGREAPPGTLSHHFERHGLQLASGLAPTAWPPARVAAVDLQRQVTGPGPTLVGRRIVVLHDDGTRAEALAERLRARDAQVMTVGPTPHALGRVDAFEPDVLVVAARDFHGPCWSTLRACWSHVRLRWAPVLVVPHEAVTEPLAHTLPALCASLVDLLAPHDDLERLAVSPTPFEVPMQALGPSRTLRALLASGRALRVTFRTSRASIDVELSDHRIVALRGGSSRTGRDKELGRGALGWLSGRARGSIRVEPLQTGGELADTEAQPVWSPVSSGVRASLPSFDDELTTVHRSSRAPAPILLRPVAPRRALTIPPPPPVGRMPEVHVPAVPIPRVRQALVRRVIISFVVGSLLGLVGASLLGLPVELMLARGLSLVAALLG